MHFFPVQSCVKALDLQHYLRLACVRVAQTIHVPHCLHCGAHESKTILRKILIAEKFKEELHRHFKIITNFQCDYNAASLVRLLTLPCNAFYTNSKITGIAHQLRTVAAHANLRSTSNLNP